MVFDSLRQSFDELLSRATKPEERRTIAARMKDTLVQARMGLDDLRNGLARDREQLAVQTQELETLRRRKQLAEGIGDRETVDLAARYEAMSAERVEVLRQKVTAHEAELALAERDVAAMSSELKGVLAGTDPRGPAEPPAIDPVTADDQDKARLHAELSSLGRAQARADREAEAARRLDELKRKMGK